MNKKNIYYLLLLFFIVSCQNINHTQELRQKLQPTWQKFFKNNYSNDSQITIYIATNRLRANADFGCDDSKFSVDLDKQINYGKCIIKVSRLHEIGDSSNLKSSNYKFINEQNYSQENFTITSQLAIDQKNFFEEIAKLDATPLIFIHGFNVRFNEAVIRSAQIAYDLKYQGPIILYSWPAGAKDSFLDEALLNKTYEQNAKNVNLSIPIFQNFIKDLYDYKLQVNLMVHSMGHQLVLPSLENLAKNFNRKIIDQLFLNAPDFDANLFKQILPNIKKISNQITLYCSYNDKAMTASKIFNKNQRLGACIENKEIDVINVSAIDDSNFGLGHGYYSSKSILNDMFLTLIGIDVRNRLFIAKQQNNSENFILRK